MFGAFFMALAIGGAQAQSLPPPGTPQFDAVCLFGAMVGREADFDDPRARRATELVHQVYDARLRAAVPDPNDRQAMLEKATTQLNEANIQSVMLRCYDYLLELGY